MGLLKKVLIAFLLIFIGIGTLNYSYADSQGFTTYTMTITEIEGLSHSFTAQINKYVNSQVVATYDVTQSVMPIYSNPIGSQYGTQFASNADLANTANTVFPQNDFNQLIANAGSMIQQYGVNTVTVNCVYSANVYDQVTGKYVNKWAVNSALWFPNIENFSGFDPANIQSKASGWIVTNPNPYVAMVTYFTHNVDIGIQQLPNYSSTIAPVLNQYLGNLLVQIYQLTPTGLGSVVATPLNTQVSAQTAYNVGFEVNEVNTTATYVPQVLVTNLINYVNNQYLAPYSPVNVIVKYIDNWSATTDSNGNLQFNMAYSLRQLNGSCQANYSYGSGCSGQCGWWGCSGLCFGGGGASPLGYSGWGSLSGGPSDLICYKHCYTDYFLSYGYLSAGVHDVSSPYTNFFNLYSMGSFSQYVQAAGDGRWTNGFSYNQGWISVYGGSWVQALILNATNCNATYYNNINFYLQGVTAQETDWLVPEPFQTVQSSDGNYYAMQEISAESVNPTALNSGNLNSGKRYAVNVNSINPNNTNFNNIIIDPFTNQLCDYTISSGTDSLGYGACSFNTSLISSIVPVTNNLTYNGQGCAPGLTYSNGYCVMPAITVWAYTQASYDYAQCVTYGSTQCYYNWDGSGGDCYYDYFGIYYSGLISYQTCPTPFSYSNGYCYAPATTTGWQGYGISLYTYNPPYTVYDVSTSPLPPTQTTQSWQYDPSICINGGG